MSRFCPAINGNHGKLAHFRQLKFSTPREGIVLEPSLLDAERQRAQMKTNWKNLQTTAAALLPSVLPAAEQAVKPLLSGRRPFSITDFHR